MEEFRTFPPGSHLFCPKVDDNDTTNYDAPDEDEEGATSAVKQKRLEESDARHITTYRLSLLLGLTTKESPKWFEEWASKVNYCLNTCDKCVKSWHSTRRGFLKSIE